jgi:hypothetical protein
MKKSNFLLLASLFALSLSSASHAQSGSLSNPTAKVFRSCDLTSRQGLVTISTKYQVVLEFPAQIEELSANRGEIMKISPDKPELIKNRLYIDAVKTSGVSDLVVIVDGDALLFRLVAENTSFNGVRKYSVQPCNTTPASTTSSASTGGSSTTLASTLRNPAWLTLNLEATNEATVTTITYNLTNNGKNAVYAVPNSLELWGKRDGQSILVMRDVKANGSSLVASRASQSGVVTITGGKGLEELSLRWAVRDAASNRDYVLERGVPLPGTTLMTTLLETFLGL